MTMDEILLEIRALREIVQSLQPASEVGHKCKGVTGKGGLCRNRSAPGSEYCRMHGDVQCKPVRVPRVAKKVKKVQPEHTHEGGGICILCGTHGNVLDMGLPDDEFEEAHA
jgi:hypothetical protein